MNVGVAKCVRERERERGVWGLLHAFQCVRVWMEGRLLQSSVAVSFVSDVSFPPLFCVTFSTE